MEATLVLLVFFALLLGVIDCGQVLFAHQALVERVRSAVRWGVVQPWEGTATDREPDPLRPDRRSRARDAPGFLGMKRENVQVRYQRRDAGASDDEMLERRRS